MVAKPEELSNLEVPLSFAVYRYREKFHLSYEDVMNEPFDEFQTNLEIMKLEAKAQEARQKGANKEGTI